MNHEEAEIEVLKKLEKYAETLKRDRNPRLAEWAAAWTWRFHTDRVRREFIRAGRAQRIKERDRNVGNRNSYFLAPGDRFVELAEQFGFSPQGLAELLCEAFARRNPRRLVLDRRTNDEDVEQLCLASIPALCC